MNKPRQLVHWLKVWDVCVFLVFSYWAFLEIIPSQLAQSAPLEPLICKAVFPPAFLFASSCAAQWPTSVQGQKALCQPQYAVWCSLGGGSTAAQLVQCHGGLKPLLLRAHGVL